MCMVVNEVKNLGIRPRLKGYWFLVDAIKMTISGDIVPGLLTKYGYLKLAKKYQTRPGCIERGIRHAIDSAWTRNPDVFKESFGFDYRPTNGEIIFEIADRVIRAEDDLEEASKKCAAG